MRALRYFGRALFAVAFIAIGVTHFIMGPKFGGEVPGFFPIHTFWVYLTGAAYVLAAISILIDVLTPLACALLGFVVFFIAFSVHLPGIIHGSGQQAIGQWINFIKAIVIGSAAWYMAGVFGTRRHQTK